MKRAIAVYVDANPALVFQTLGLIESLRYVADPTTDLVIFGPQGPLMDMPDLPFVKKVMQPQFHLLPHWHGYAFINSIACMVADGSEILTHYDHVLRSDVDVFLTPAWRDFHPTTFVTGRGAYSNSDNVRQKTIDVANRLGFKHRGRHNIGSTWYGPTEMVREACRVSLTAAFHLLNDDFRHEAGAWPDWYRGVTSMYAGEIAVNHVVPEAMLEERPDLLDYGSTSAESVMVAPHIHCWHTDETFSKFAFQRGKYDHLEEKDLDLGVIRDYCTAMAVRGQKDFR